MLKDAIGREWQLSTIQLDFNLPERFELEYAGDDGAKHRPVVIHRAILGSTERFLGILIEHFAGSFPLWMSPTQLQIIPVSKDHNKTAKKLEALLQQEGFRVQTDDSNESVGYKIRRASTQKTPLMIVVGEKEKSLKKFMVRIRGKQTEKAMTSKQLIEYMHENINKKKIAL